MNNNITQVTPAPDALMDRYNELALAQNVDSKAYAREWRRLADRCDAENRPALAGMCRSRAEQYQREPAGEYVRLLDGNFSELVLVEAA